MGESIISSDCTGDPLDVKLRKIEIFGASISNGDTPYLNKTLLGPYVLAKEIFERLQPTNLLRIKYNILEINRYLALMVQYCEGIEAKGLPQKN